MKWVGARSHPPPTLSHQQKQLRWALAARNRGKLERIRDQLEELNPDCKVGGRGGYRLGGQAQKGVAGCFRSSPPKTLHLLWLALISTQHLHALL